MTLNDLLRQAQTIAGQLSGGDIPMKIAVGLHRYEDVDMHFRIRTGDNGAPFVEIKLH